jgi:hypothetical protein
MPERCHVNYYLQEEVTTIIASTTSPQNPPATLATIEGGKDDGGKYPNSGIFGQRTLGRGWHLFGNYNAKRRNGITVKNTQIIASEKNYDLRVNPHLFCRYSASSLCGVSIPIVMQYEASNL